jgi:hypothetical protein
MTPKIARFSAFIYVKNSGWMRDRSVGLFFTKGHHLGTEKLELSERIRGATKKAIH